MQKTIIKLLILTIVLSAALSASYLFAVWTGPTQSPPLGNTLPPINIGNINQVKDAGLSVNALTVFGNGYVEGDVGIGVVSPSEALEVAGNIKATQGIQVGNTTNANAGTIRWSGIDLEVYNGTEWKSLTAKGGGDNTCAVSGSKSFTTIGESFLTVDDSMKNCLFVIEVKGAGGYSYIPANGRGGRGGGVVFNYKPSSTGTFGIYVGEGGTGGVNHNKKTLGGGGTGAGSYGGYVGSGGGASAVKFNSTVLAISGGGGSAYNGSDGGGANDPGGIRGGNNGIGGISGNSGSITSAGNGGNAGQNGVNNYTSEGGIGVPAYNIGGGGGGGWGYGGGYGGYGGYGGGGGGYGGGAGAGSVYDDSGSGSGGGGGFIDVYKVASFAKILGSDDMKNGSVLIEWK